MKVERTQGALKKVARNITNILEARCVESYSAQVWSDNVLFIGLLDED
jgi:hypothetical protein